MANKKRLPLPSNPFLGFTLPPWLKRNAKDVEKKPAKDSEESSIMIPRAATSLGAQFGEALTTRAITFAVKREPVAHRIVFALAHDIYDKWFEVTPLGEIKKEEAKKFNATVQMPLADLNAQDVFTQAAAFERAYGWSIIVIGYEDQGKSLEDPVDQPTRVFELVAYAPTQISDVKVDEDPESERYGDPVLYEIIQSPDRKPKVHYTRVIHFATRKLEPGYKGISVLEPVWDDLTTLRNIRWGMGQTMYRYGSGFPVLTIPGASKAELEEWEKTWGPLTARTQLFKNETQEIEFKGVAGRALNPEPYYIPIMENISAGTSIPMAILRGAQAGALTGSEVNEREYFKIVSDAQTRYEPGIRQLLNILIEIEQVETDIKDYQVNWLGGFEINPRDQVAAELDRARTNDLKTSWMTLNEIRALEGLDPVEGGDVILKLLELQAKIAGASGNLLKEYLRQNAVNKKSRRKQEVEAKFGKPIRELLAEGIDNDESVKNTSKKLGISTATYYDWAREEGLIR